ncbi:hypothetical protein CANCADRAFT_3383 [Tortispora caseinolytica NRRL Y-17796]|uniref:AmmeMemoRadiSam system protein B n=1 Tax=Tortispora caseinolytica NRRL Y-17796 TaxID=767744 RepID=A0A1E4TAD6_9ASCO|nr:hypothetical protein CANCADRAFT_3383 [Tortispora caseinolytica NRRL Y-17796]
MLTTNSERVFVLGPAHHLYLDGCALTACKVYETPLGNLPICMEIVSALDETNEFEKMNISDDEDEHSLEMHMPFIYKKMSMHKDGIRPIIPILVGAIDTHTENMYGLLLEKYFSDPKNAFVISSDFCHWGRRFSYTGYASTPEVYDSYRLLGTAAHDPKVPIFKGIQYLDSKALEVISLVSHPLWAEYLNATRNTICGRHPISILIVAMQHAEVGPIKWLHYAQSSEVRSINESSVSYVAGFTRYIDNKKPSSESIVEPIASAGPE